MPFVSHAALRCPIDQHPLVLEGNRLVCESGHSFDLARQGYANLLMSHQKRSKDPGDSGEMVAARHQFLRQGYFAPILDSISALLMPQLSEGAVIVDAGCGEGYYLDGLLAHAESAGLSPHGIGFDISKSAMQVAARRRSATWMVASNRAIPLANHSADVILDLFGFPHAEEFRRVLKPSGLLVRVTAGRDHLMALRSLAYDEITSKDGGELALDGFHLTHREQIAFTMDDLAQPAISQLFMMTPHYFRASKVYRERILALDTLSVGADVIIECYAPIA